MGNYRIPLNSIMVSIFLDTYIGWVDKYSICEPCIYKYWDGNAVGATPRLSPSSRCMVYGGLRVLNLVDKKSDKNISKSVKGGGGSPVKEMDLNTFFTPSLMRKRDWLQLTRNEREEKANLEWKWHFPHSWFGHFQCLNRKSKTTSIETYP